MVYQRPDDYEQQLEELLDNAFKEAMTTLVDITKNAEDDRARNAAASSILELWKAKNGYSQKAPASGNGGGSSTIQFNVVNLKQTLAGSAKALLKVDRDSAFEVMDIVREVEGTVSVLETGERMITRVAGDTGLPPDAEGKELAPTARDVSQTDEDRARLKRSLEHALKEKNLDIATITEVDEDE
jgi:hypothetical protein